ncbi:MAG: dockerin type I repeat-containing protein [Planctomycetota bacterium]
MIGSPQRRRFSPISLTAAMVAVLLTVAGAGFGQTTIQSDPIAGPGSSAHKHVVRTSTGDLYTLTIYQDAAGARELRLYRSTSGGASWTLETSEVHDATSGAGSTDPTNACAMAIDSQDRLHITWARYYYPSFFEQFYRQYETANGTLSPIVDISAVTGAAVSTRTAAMAIAVDGTDTVWIVAHGTGSWVERLIHSSLPFASDLAFEDVGPISPSASAQNSRIAVDSLGRVHCSFYRNTGSGNYEHRIYDPAVGWGSSEVLGNTTPTNDYYGMLSADELGNVHAAYVADSATGSTWLFEYRVWSGATGWSAPIPFSTASAADYTGVANYRIFALACDEASGTARLAYRDLASGGALLLAEKDLADPTFTVIETLEPPSLGQHAYYLPTIRGQLYPTTNQTGSVLDLTWQLRPTPGTPPYDLRFQRLPIGGGLFRRGDANADGVFDVSDTVYSLAALFIIGSDPPSCAESADVNDDETFDVSDVVYALAALFIPGSLPPPPPGPQSCGSDAQPTLGCLGASGCP